MYLILSVLGLLCLTLMIMAVIRGDFLSAAVILAAFLTFFGLWKWQKTLAPKTWTQIRFKYGKIIRIAVGLIFFAMSMLQFGLVVRTLWDEYVGPTTGSRWDGTDVFSPVLLAAIAFALIGYEKFAAAIFMEFFFSMNLGVALVFLFVNQNSSEYGIYFTCIFALAFLAVFIFGQWFHWSKGFALTGLLGVMALYLGVYLTM